LGFGGGGARATEEKQQVGKYPGWDWGWVDNEEEDYGHQRQRTRRKLFSRMLLDCDKLKDREEHETPTKQGSGGFMSSVRRISLVGRIRGRSRVLVSLSLLRQVLRVCSSIAAAVVLYFPRREMKLYRPRCRSPFRPSQLRQVSCRCAFLKLRGHPIDCIINNNHLTIRTGNLHLTSRRIVSASSGRSDASFVFPSSTVSGGSGSVSGSHSLSTGVGWSGLLIFHTHPEL